MAQEIRNYRFTYQVPSEGGEHYIETNEPVMSKKEEVIEAYDLNEALVQFNIKHSVEEYSILEIIPFKYAEEQNPVTEQKKEVHVKPNIVRTK